MRKVTLTMEEMDKYSTIKKLIETDGNKKRAAMALSCSVRHINRMIKGYKEVERNFLFMVIVEENQLTLSMRKQII